MCEVGEWEAGAKKTDVDMDPLIPLQVAFTACCRETKISKEAGGVMAGGKNVSKSRQCIIYFSSERPIVSTV